MFRDSAFLPTISGNNGILQLFLLSMVEWHTREISPVGYLCKSLCWKAKICHYASMCLCLLCCYISVNMCKLRTHTHCHTYLYVDLYKCGHKCEQR